MCVSIFLLRENKNFSTTQDDFKLQIVQYSVSWHLLENYPNDKLKHKTASVTAVDSSGSVLCSFSK